MTWANGGENMTETVLVSFFVETTAEFDQFNFKLFWQVRGEDKIIFRDVLSG